MNGNMNYGMATTDKTALHPPSPWTTYVKGDPLATHSVQQGRGTHRTVSIIMQTEGSLSMAPPNFLELITEPGQSLILHSRDQFSLGMLKLVAGAATSIATTYPELPPLSSGLCRDGADAQYLTKSRITSPQIR